MTAQVSLRCNILRKDGYIRECDQTAKHCVACRNVSRVSRPSACLTTRWCSPHSSVGLQKIGTYRS
jgi:hypothetical protein